MHIHISILQENSSTVAHHEEAQVMSVTQKHLTNTI